MGTLWPKSASFEFDQNGEAAPGAKAYFYEAGTSTPRPTYTTAALSTPRTHPVLADGDGRWPAVFLDFGSYKQELFTAGGTELSSIDDIPNPAPFDETFELDETAIYNTGDYIFVGKNGTRTGAVRCNGRTIGSAASSATERANADTADLYAYLWDNYANGQLPVATGRGASAAADFAANKAITLPDHRGASLVGFSDMGNTDNTLLASAPVVSGSGILAGSIIGANTHTLQTTEAPAHTHSFSATTSSDNAHSHTYSGTTSSDGSHTHNGTTGTESVTHTHAQATPSVTNGTFTGSGANGWGGTYPNNSTGTGNASANHTHTFTTDAGGTHSHTYSGTTSTQGAHTHTVSGTSGSTGGGGAHNNLSRAIPVTVLMKL